MAKISIPIAVKGKIDLNLASTHRTTTDFGQLQVSNFIPVIPNDDFHISVFSEARFAPMVVPTFMNVELVTRAFYVPMSAIYMPFENFYSQKSDASAFKTLPTIDNNVFVQYFVEQGSLVYPVPNGSKFDFIYQDPNGVVTRCVFTERGRLMKKLFESLGYKLNWSKDDHTSFCILPLLAFLRVCYDYVYPSQYLDGLALLKYFKITSSSDFNSCFGSLSLVFGFCNHLLDVLQIPYHQDYFTSAWQDINQPGLAGSLQSLNVYSPDTINQSTTGSAIQSNLNPKISQYALQKLQALYNYVTRRNILGTRYADQIFGIFGIGSRKSDPDMSQFLGETIQPINVVDVTAMSASDNQELGELAGKAFIKGQGHLCDFSSADEFGYILCLTFVRPKVGYYQGRKRWTTCFDKYDFYTPEFDMQMRAIRNDELFADYMSYDSYNKGQAFGGNPANRFAFAPMYSELKKGEDWITGDFNIPTLSENLDAYYLARTLKTPSSENPLALNADFLFQKQHEYDKIFSQMYSLRVDIQTSQVGIYTDVIHVEQRPLVFYYPSNNPTGGWIFNVVNGIVYPVWKTTSELSSLNIVIINRNTCYAVLGVANSFDNIVFSLQGRRFILSFNSGIPLSSDDSASGYSSIAYLNYVDSIWEDGDGFTSTLSWESFIGYFQDYIDHIYLGHFFKINASRGVRPISTEFMIDDGGRKVGVDMNGQRFD